MSNILDRVDALVAALKLLQPMSAENKQRLDKKFRLEFNYNSNHMEGNTLTYVETELLLIFDDTKGGHSLRELEEMKSHDVAYHLVEEWAKDMERPLTEQYIKNLNEIILVRPYWSDAQTPDAQKTRRLIKVGDYKEHPNSVRLANGELFQYASPTETPIKMQELIDWYRSEENAIHALTLAAMLHYKFVRIHPFDDGNGRISRLLMNYVFLRNGLPPVIIKSSDKKNYLNALHLADVGDYGAFIDYIGEQLILSLEMSIKAAKGESIEEPNDIEKEISLWKKQFTQEKEAELKCDTLVIDVFYKCLFNLFDEFSLKMNDSFKDVFAKWEEMGFVNNGNSNHYGIKYIRDHISMLVKYINDKESNDMYEEVFGQKVVNTKTDNIKLQIDMLGFKKDGTNTFNIFNNLEIELQDFKYLVKFNGQVKAEKLYQEYIDRQDISAIVNDAIKDTFKNIKLSLKNPPLSEL